MPQSAAISVAFGYLPGMPLAAAISVAFGYLPEMPTVGCDLCRLRLLAGNAAAGCDLSRQTKSSSYLSNLLLLESFNNTFRYIATVLRVSLSTSSFQRPPGERASFQPVGVLLFLSNFLSPCPSVADWWQLTQSRMTTMLRCPPMTVLDVRLGLSIGIMRFSIQSF